MRPAPTHRRDRRGGGFEHRGATTAKVFCSRTTFGRLAAERRPAYLRSVPNCNLDLPATASRCRLLRRVRCALLFGIALTAGGCQFLQNEFYYLDRAQPAPPVLNAGEPGFGGE